MSRYKVSVCIPAYRQPDSLRRALRSVFVQKFSDFEIIVTDDSPDTSVEAVISEFRGRSNMRYFRNAARLGTPENWNRAVREANGEFIKVLHHDDWLADENSLGDFVELLERDTCTDFAFCAAQAFDGQGRLLFVHRPSKAQLRRLRTNPGILFFGNFIGAPSATIYRSSVKQQYDQKLKWVVDIDFYTRVLRDNPHFQFSSRPLVCITSDAPQQVTKECAGNRMMEVYEWLYLYRKLSASSKFSLARLMHLRSIFKAHGIKSRRDLANCGVDFPIPVQVDLLLAWQRVFESS
jgi:glycosyltransferase involved in cell wall biosynthesis